MGPMIARLVISQLLSDQLSQEQLISLLAVHNHDSNNDYNIENMDMKNLLTEMKKKFNPKRPSLSKFM